MENYESLLDEAYKKVKVVQAREDRFEVPKVEGQVQGKNTLITNISQIADYLRRPADQLAKLPDDAVAKINEVLNKAVANIAKHDLEIEKKNAE